MYHAPFVSYVLVTVIYSYRHTTLTRINKSHFSPESNAVSSFIIPTKNIIRPNYSSLNIQSTNYQHFTILTPKMSGLVDVSGINKMLLLYSLWDRAQVLVYRSFDGQAAEAGFVQDGHFGYFADVLSSATWREIRWTHGYTTAKTVKVSFSGSWPRFASATIFGQCSMWPLRALLVKLLPMLHPTEKATSSTSLKEAYTRTY